MLTLNKTKSCRTCLEDCEEVATTIYDKIEESEYLTIVDLLRDFTFIKMTDFEDQFPQSVCSSCYEKIKFCHEFKLLCQKTENTILKQLEDNLQTQPFELIIKTEPLSPEIPETSTNCLDDTKNLCIKEDSNHEPFIKVEEIKHEYILESSEIDSFDYKFKTEYTIDSNKSESDRFDTYVEDFLNDPTEVEQSDENQRKAQENDANRIVCLTCDSELRNERLFFNHAIINHENQRIFKSRTYTVDSILLRETYYCLKCKIIFCNRRRFMNHILYDHQEEPYECPDCDGILENFETYQEHIANCYKEIFICSFCDTIFTHINDYNLHKEIIKHESDGILCSYCGYIQKHYSTYIIHLRIHTGEKPYVCNICDKSFAQLGSLKSHKAFNHSEERNHICPQCGARFKSNSSLCEHLRIHSGEKKNECSICGFKFLSRSHLKRHYSVHSEERNEVCTICNKRYKRKSGLNLHMKIHTGKNMHVCTVCDKSFAQRVCLRNHMKKFHQVDETKE